MHYRIVGTLLALLAAFVPMQAWAQGMDATTRAVVARAAAEAAYGVVPNAPQPAGFAVSAQPESDVRIPEDSASDDAGADSAEPLDLTDLETYTADGVTIEAPAAWIVDPGMDPSTPFLIEVPDTDLYIYSQANSDDFPGLAGVAIFSVLADELAAEFGEGMEVVEAAAGLTAQGIPTYYFTFAGESEGEQMGGVFYVFAPGPTAYLLLAMGTLEDWQANVAGVEHIANSMTFADEVVTLQQAGDEPLVFVSEDGMTSVTVPPNWLVTDSNDEELPLLVSEPGVSFVVAIGTEKSFGEELRPDIAELFAPTEGEANPEDFDALVDAIVDMMGASGTDMQLDASRQAVYTRDGAVTIRLVGEIELDEGIPFTLATYVDLRESGGVLMIIFGDVDAALAEEGTLLEMMESIEVQE